MMEHKAFLFDYAGFARSLKPTLERALATGDLTALVAFITENIGSLKDPAAGKPLGPGWEAHVEPKDVHQYGDVALTLFYDPNEELGLGPKWESAQEIVSRELRGDRSPILGSPLGAFDPGKMGSYFQSAEDLRTNLRRLEELVAKEPGFRRELKGAIDMLRHAAHAEKGLYVTF